MNGQIFKRFDVLALKKDVCRKYKIDKKKFHFVRIGWHMYLYIVNENAELCREYVYTGSLKSSLDIMILKNALDKRIEELMKKYKII
jgi:hypothetical protein